MIYPNIVVAIEGLPKSGKTYLALTFPDPIVIFSLDIGQDPVIKEFPDKKIEVIEYPMPIIDSVKAVSQQQELKAIWDTLMEDTKRIVANPDVNTIIFDTFTVVYQVAQAARAAELGLRSLWIESGGGGVLYGDVYARLRGIIHRIRLSGKNLVLTHYLRDRYVGQENTGEKEIQGWAGAEAEADLVLVTRRGVKEQINLETKKKEKKNVILTTIKDSRFHGLELSGADLEMTNYNELITMVMG